MGPSIKNVPTAPQPLLNLLARHDPVALVDGTRIGRISKEKLAKLLVALDPADYGSGNYDGWIRLAAACHDA